jgi:membrane protease YdiL (CAAX protease family)
MSNASSEATAKSGFLRRKKREPAGNFGPALLVFATTILIFIISQLIAAFIIELVSAVLHHGSAPGGDTYLSISATADFFYVLLAETLSIWLVFKVVKARGLKLGAIGLGRRPKWNDLIKALLGFGVFYALLIVAGLILSLIFPNLNTNQTQDIGFNTLNNSLDHVLAFVALVFLPPLGEETLVRGYLYSGLRARWRFVPAMLATSLLFGIAHLQTGQGASLLWAAGVDTFVLSLVLVYLRESTGALYAGMLVHSVNNLIAFGVHFRGLIF